MAVNMFLEFVGQAIAAGGPIGVVGESTDKAHPRTIELLEVEVPMENSVTLTSVSAGAGGGKMKFDALNFTKWVDNASPSLFQALAVGAHFPSMKLYARKAGSPVDYLVYQFSMVFITRIDVSASNSGDAFRESVQIAYAAMQVTYTPVGPVGQPGKSSTAVWNQITNTPSLDVPGM